MTPTAFGIFIVIIAVIALGLYVYRTLGTDKIISMGAGGSPKDDPRNLDKH